MFQCFTQCYSVTVKQTGDKERETWVGLVLLSCLLVSRTSVEEEKIMMVMVVMITITMPMVMVMMLVVMV